MQCVTLTPDNNALGCFMIGSKFFTNCANNTLFQKFQGIKGGMQSLHSFHAVVGYFRSSGYFKVREELGEISKIQILIGINLDDVFRNHNPNLLFLRTDSLDDEVRKIYQNDFRRDISEAGYMQEIEEGILQLVDDVEQGKVELKIYPTKNLHAKFYLFLPENHTEHTDGWVIMGSSNLSDSGLGLTRCPRYELNVAMKEYCDVAFCKQEFDNLWKDALPLSIGDLNNFKSETYLGNLPTPYELYMKVLIDFFQGQVEDDFSLEIPPDVLKLKYQSDAVGQGYEMLKKHHGFFLADVVGLGKTIVATMVAKRFIEENGRRETKVLVVYPPALEQNWREIFNKFNIGNNSDFVSCGSLDKILDEKGNYRAASEYDMVIVDEAHRFRGSTSAMYDKLQRICKASRAYHGRVGGRRKSIILISATPLNNRPDDLYNLLLLFQDASQSTIDGISNLQNYFSPKCARYKQIMSASKQSIDIQEIDELYENIRQDVIDKITVRRTRNNILKNPDYAKDLDKQQIAFPTIQDPREIVYTMSENLANLFSETMYSLTESLHYSRYKAIERLTGDYSARYENAAATSRSLAGIYRTHMVKRLESSFAAFRKSLTNLKQSTEGMIHMFESDTVIILSDLKVKELQEKGLELEEIIEQGIDKLKLERDAFVYPASAFDPLFVEELKHDLMIINQLIEDWNKIHEDPKLDRFIQCLQTQCLDPQENPTGKLVIFSESKDTVRYLENQLIQRLERKDVLSVSSQDRRQKFEEVKANFDANYPDKSNQYQILITTDVLAEGVNLHQANVIINYDTPWNASKLMQRIGRVNRIGSTASSIINYMFYPSAEGDLQIGLYKNALGKLQGFHSAYGEDSQIYSREEIVQQFKLFNPDIEDSVDKSLAFLYEVRALRKRDPEYYERIKALPFKSRTGRDLKEAKKSETQSRSSLIYMATSVKQEFYLVEESSARPIGFLAAAELFKADREEHSQKLDDVHYTQVALAKTQFSREVTQMIDSQEDFSIHRGLSPSVDAALSLLRRMKREDLNSSNQYNVVLLEKYVLEGTFVALTRDLARYHKQFRNSKSSIEEVLQKLNTLVFKYDKAQNRSQRIVDINMSEPQIVLSETFI